MRAVSPGLLTRTTTLRQAPLRIGFFEEYARLYLIGQLFGNLLVDLRQLRRREDEVRAPARFLRELLEHELRFLELGPVRAARTQPDGVDRRLRSLGQIEHFFVGHEARSIVSVGEDDDGLAADLFSGARLGALELLQRDVDRVVERGRSVDVRGPNRFLERRDVVGERLQDARLAVEVDHLDDVLPPHPPGEADRGFLCRPQPLVHAGARVEQDRERDGLLDPREERDRLLRPILVDLEVRLLQVADVAAGLHDGHVQ